MKKRGIKYDLIFIILAAALILLLSKTGQERIIEDYALVFVLVAYLIGRQVGKALKEKENQETAKGED